MEEGKKSLVKTKERRRKEEVRMHDHTWSKQQTKSRGNAHDGHGNNKDGAMHMMQ